MRVHGKLRAEFSFHQMHLTLDKQRLQMLNMNSSIYSGLCGYLDVSSHIKHSFVLCSMPAMFVK